MSTLKIIKYFVITNFLFISIGCSYNGTIPENTNLFKKINSLSIENNIYYDESSINTAQNLIFTPPLLGEYNINYKNIVNNYSKNMLERNFQRINDKNANREPSETPTHYPLLPSSFLSCDWRKSQR